MTIIRHATFPADTDAVFDIWREFIASSPIDLGYQGNDAEFVALPGRYARPAGCVLIADRMGDVDGCVALRKIDAGIVEMKRLYIRPRARGERLGRALAEQAIAEARIAGYREVRLDVQEKSLAARQLYAALGFVPAAPVSFNPVPGASFLGLVL